MLHNNAVVPAVYDLGFLQAIVAVVRLLCCALSMTAIRYGARWQLLVALLPKAQHHHDEHNVMMC
jgi:hypothetical protein